MCVGSSGTKRNVASFLNSTKNNNDKNNDGDFKTKSLILNVYFDNSYLLNRTCLGRDTL